MENDMARADEVLPISVPSSPLALYPPHSAQYIDHTPARLRMYETHLSTGNDLVGEPSATMVQAVNTLTKVQAPSLLKA